MQILGQTYLRKSPRLIIAYCLQENQNTVYNNCNQEIRNVTSKTLISQTLPVRADIVYG